MSNLSGFDLNLLVAFDALMAERNVSRAAAKLGITQPALSHALKRLRMAFNDELFIRTRNSMQPTARAFSLEPSIRSVLDECLSTLINHASFDPASAKRTFKLSMSDGTAAIVLPAIMP
jgi:LysR family transcriptional activator of mexEF-oprN operon